jgi:hypothetical protein
LKELSSLQVLDFSGQALVEVANVGECLRLFKAPGEVSINDLQLVVLHSPDPVDWLVRQVPRAVVDDLNSVCGVFCCAKFCKLEACGG